MTLSCAELSIQCGPCSGGESEPPQAAPDPCTPNPWTSLVLNEPTSCHIGRLAAISVSAISQSLFIAPQLIPSGEPAISIKRAQAPQVAGKGAITPPTLATARAQ